MEFGGVIDMEKIVDEEIREDAITITKNCMDIKVGKKADTEMGHYGLGPKPYKLQDMNMGYSNTVSGRTA